MNQTPSSILTPPNPHSDIGIHSVTSYLEFGLAWADQGLVVACAAVHSPNPQNEPKL